jgi:hypothetical protein
METQQQSIVKRQGNAVLCGWDVSENINTVFSSNMVLEYKFLQKYCIENRNEKLESMY